MNESVFFYIFSTLAVLAVILMIFQTNPVASALCLVFSFFNFAALYILLEASFLAILQILVYAGAVMVLFVFVIMFLNLRDEDLIDDRVTLKKAGIIVLGIGFIFFLGFKLFAVGFGDWAEITNTFGQSEPVGRLLFTTYLIPFELISILILVALIGVLLLGKKT